MAASRDLTLEEIQDLVNKIAEFDTKFPQGSQDPNATIEERRERTSWGAKLSSKQVRWAKDAGVLQYKSNNLDEGKSPWVINPNPTAKRGAGSK